MITLTQEKAAEIVAALSAAESALLKMDATSGQNGVIAGRCAIAKVYLATSMRGPRFARTYCLQCGADLGPGDADVRGCADHGERLRRVPFSRVVQ